MRFLIFIILAQLSIADDGTTRFQKANEAMLKRELDTVIELLNPYTDQLSQLGYLLLANAYSQKRDYVNEVRILSLLASKDEENHQWQFLLGGAYLRQAKLTTDPKRNKELVDTGIQKLRRTLEIKPKFKPGFDLLVQTLLSQKANHDAREILSEGLDKFGNRPEILKELCRLNSTDGFLVQAVQICRDSIKLSPDYPDSYVFLVQSLHDQGEDTVAEKEIVQAARKFPNSEFVQWAGGKFFGLKKNLSVSARYYEQAVKAKADSARAQYGLAMTLLELGEYEKAFPAFKKACELDAAMAQESFLNAASRLRQKNMSQLAEKYNSTAYSCKKR